MKRRKSSGEIQQLWEEELGRRKVSKLPHWEIGILQDMRTEKKFGVEWICKHCETSFRVKNPFRKLFCPDCLKKLERQESFLPKSNKKKGYWVLEE